VPETRQRISQLDLRLILQGYELWNEGDPEGLAALCFTDDIEWQNAPEWPGQRAYRGAGEVVRFLREEVVGVIELGDIEIERLDVHGDEVVISMLARTRGQESNLDIGKIPVFHVARIRDGKVCRIRAFLDREEAVAAAGSR
jgi:ketosteroid isomerase-like protein